MNEIFFKKSAGLRAVPLDEGRTKEIQCISENFFRMAEETEVDKLEEELRETDTRGSHLTLDVEIMEERPE